MNLHRLLESRARAGNPVRVVLIGAGKFGSMYLSQARRTTGIHVLAVADLAPDRARASLARVGWEAPRYAARSLDEAAAGGTTFVTDDAMAAIAHHATEVVIDATGHPAAGIAHVLACCAQRKHVVMVNVEADALAGPLLARRAAEAGIVYSLAYGDQPALVCELVDWARAAGFTVVAGGKGTKYLPAYHASTPRTVWGHYGFGEETVAKGDFNAQMFNSFLDGTKSGIEMAAVANATGLTPAPEGLAFPPCGVDDLARVLRPRSAGGSLHHAGQVEVISSLERDGRPVFRDLRWGVYVTFAAEHEYVRRCFQEYGIVTDPGGEYASMYKPSHLIGLELGVSVASVALRNEPTGAATGWRADCVATAKRALAAGEVLDGEGGYTVWGRLMTAADSAARRALPIGLAHGVKLKRAIPEGQVVSWDDVEYDEGSQAVQVRREMERVFGNQATDLRRSAFTAVCLALCLAAPLAALAEVKAKDAWVRGTVPAQKTTGFFVTLTSGEDAKLVAASTPAAKRTEIHSSRMEGGIVRMEAVDSVALPAGRAVELKPGGYHVMLIGLSAPMKAGDTVPVTLTVEDRRGKRSSVEVKAEIRPLAGR